MKSRKKRAPRKKTKRRVWELHLYVSQETPQSALAAENLRRLCERYLQGQYRLSIVDIGRKPSLAREHEIVATPTLMRISPEPRKILIGTLSNTWRVLTALELSDDPEKLVSLLSSPGFHLGSA